MFYDLFPIRDRAGREFFQLFFPQDLGNGLRSFVSKLRFSYGGTVGGHAAPNAGENPHCVVGFNNIKVESIPALQYADIHVLVYLFAEFLHYRTSYPQQTRMANVGLSQLKGPKTQAIVVGCRILFYISPVLKGRKNTKNIVLMKFEPA